MKSLVIYVSILCSLNVVARPIKVMSFNTTCSLCSKKKFDKYKKRKYWIVDTIKRNSPDLISLQEIMFGFQLRWISKKLPEYHVVTKRLKPLGRYPDSTLLVRKSIFSILKSDGFWLSPKSNKFIGSGWKTSLPRYIVTSKIKHKASGLELIFSGSHFDNNKVNKNNSARLVSEFFSKQNLPIIFAADTNLKPGSKGFETIKENLDDSFDLKSNMQVIANTSQKSTDSCNLEKGIVFPDCRVDHIFLSKSINWQVSDWIIDQYKYGQNQNFVSDHRAIIVNIDID